MPKTTDQEKLEGNPGRRSLPENEPNPEKKIPAPPKWLGRKATRAYHDLSRIVGSEGMNVMAETDGLALSMLCDAFSEYRDMRLIIEDPEKRFYKSKEKAGKILIKRHPAVGDMQDAWKRVVLMLGKFGMTPFDRKGVQVLADSPEESREDKIAKRRAEAALKAKEAALKGKHIKKVGNV
ncbi:MAG: P27 family phage terminase small subunit [Deltaproteobacteria bacterium]|nr:P27 family phage terminase small subunit [Deltaproteobacteria bacterium]